MRISLLLLTLALGCSSGNATPSSSTPSTQPAPERTEPALAEPDQAEAEDVEGAQPETGQLCGTRGAAQCPAGTFCDFDPGSNCGADDRGGHCAVIPEVCTREYMPVCGCDGQTHPTACTAHSNGVAVAHDGPC